MKDNKTCPLLLAALIILALTACGPFRAHSPVQETTGAESGFIEESPEEDPNGVYDLLEDRTRNEDLIAIGFVAGGMDSGYILDMSESIRSFLNQANGYELTVLDAHMDAKSQQESAGSLIESGVDYLIILPMPGTDWNGVLKKARDADIPVIFVGDVPDGVDEALYLSAVTGDAEAESRMALEWLYGYFDEDGPARLVGVTVDESVLDHGERLDHFLETARSEKGWEYETLDLKKGDTASTKAAIEACLAADSQEHLVIVCADSGAAEQTVLALEETDFTDTGANSRPLVITFESTKTIREWVEDGQIAMAVDSRTDYGSALDTLIRGDISGDTPEKAIRLTPGQVYDPIRSASRKDLLSGKSDAIIAKARMFD